MVQASLATKTQSFGLVREEIEHTIGQAEQSLERFQENRESGEDLLELCRLPEPASWHFLAR
jgi:hypothetical protein